MAGLFGGPNVPHYVLTCLTLKDKFISGINLLQKTPKHMYTCVHNHLYYMLPRGKHACALVKLSMNLVKNVPDCILPYKNIYL